ncbi:hypothetical protein ABZZ80_17940 [Streptomyces sp. NPDC006356]
MAVGPCEALGDVRPGAPAAEAVHGEQAGPAGLERGEPLVGPQVRRTGQEQVPAGGGDPCLEATRMASSETVRKIRRRDAVMRIASGASRGTSRSRANRRTGWGLVPMTNARSVSVRRGRPGDVRSRRSPAAPPARRPGTPGRVRFGADTADDIALLALRLTPPPG